MATKHVLLEYFITLTDPQSVVDHIAADNALAHHGLGGSVNLLPLQSPLAAANEFGVPISDPQGRLLSQIVPPSLQQVGPAIAPSITSSWFYSKENFPINVTAFTRKSGGWFGISVLFGTTTHYYWKRNWQLAGAGGGTTLAGAESACATYRWINGFETGDTGESNGAAPAAHQMGKHASRHVDGQGLAFRDDGTNGQEMLVNTFGGAASVQTSWERFYLRLIKAPTASTPFWCARSTPSPARGMVLSAEVGNGISLGSSDSFGTVTTHGSIGTLTPNVWKRVDILLTYRGAGAVGSGVIEVYLDGALVTTLNGPAGLDEATGLHVGSRLGRYGFGTSNAIEIDFDDWSNATLPTTNAGGEKAGKDWRNGSKMQLVRASSITALGGYAGDFRSLLQIPAGNSAAPDATMSSSAALAVLGVGMDADLSVDKYRQNKGVCAIQAIAFTLAANATNGRLGIKMPGGAVAFQNIDNPNGVPAAWRGIMRSDGTVTPPTALAGLEVHVEHPNAAVSLTVAGVAAIAMILGRWGNEDPALLPATAATVPTIAGRGPHNSPYPGTPWATQGAPPPASYRITGGTYVGTGVPRDLTLLDIPHWLFIRRTSGAVVVNNWWSSMNGAHRNLDGGIRAQVMPNVRVDPAYVSTGLEVQEIKGIVTLLNSIDTNEVGVTYQYVAVSDPGSRFMYNDAFQHAVVNASHDNLFKATGFTPEALWMMEERETAFGANRIFYKGPGHGTLYAQLINSAENANSGSFGVGKFTSRASMHPAGFSVALSAWRRDDSSGDAGIVKAVQIGSYTGDGVGARAIALTPASGVRPLFAMVVPHNGAGAIFRDPSHTGTTSTKMDGTADAATGITGAAVDTLNVNSALNAVGIVYDFFVLPGSAVAGNGGFSGNGEFTPVDPTVDYAGGGWENPFIDFPDFEGENPTAGEAPPDLDDDLSTECSPFTHRMVNIALSRIGVNLELTDMGTQLVPEATQARLHYLETVEQVLRDFPWPFATRYATLVLTGGTADVPVNGDWQYSYAKPSRYIFGRRIVREGMKRLFDPLPPPFRVGNDDTLDRIYTDEVDPELEYTYRPVCAAGSGDALFRDALCWRLAMALCKPLAKDEKTFQVCVEGYRAALANATTAGSNEQSKQNPREDGDADWIQARA